MPTILAEGGRYSLNGFPIDDVANGRVIDITSPNQRRTLTNAKGRGSMVTDNVQGKQKQVVMRILRGSYSDINIFRSLYNLQETDGSLRLTLVYDQEVYDDVQRKMILESTIFEGGIFTNEPDSGQEIDGDNEVAVQVWTMLFATSTKRNS